MVKCQSCGGERTLKTALDIAIEYNVSIRDIFKINKATWGIRIYSIEDNK